MKQEEYELFGQYDSYTKDQLIVALDNALERVPEDQRASATFCVDKEYDYDSDRVRFLMQWQRPLTFEEEEEKKRLEFVTSQLIKARELKQLEELSKKYGVNND